MMKEKSGFIIYYSLFVIRNSINLNIKCKILNFEHQSKNHISQNLGNNQIIKKNEQKLIQITMPGTKIRF